MSLGRKLGSPFRKAAQVSRFHSLQADKGSRSVGRCEEAVGKLAKDHSIAKKRKRLITELFETEKTYQHHLFLLTTLFLQPLRDKNILPLKAIESIFSNIEAIQKINSQLLDSMEKSGVAKAFQEMAPFMKLYSLYANNYENATKVVEEYDKKSLKFLKFKEGQESHPEMRGLRLLALLITPIQRVPRYKLLLESIQDQTSPSHGDYKILQDACCEINKLATHINECIRQHENFQKMLQIQNSLTGEGVPRILIPGRLFLKEGTLLKVGKRGGSKERVIFLFNDILICTKKEASHFFNCRHVLSLADCVIEQLLGGNNPGGGTVFKVIAKTTTLLFYSDSQQDAASWMHDMKMAIAELHANLASLRRTQQETEAILYSRKDLINVKRGTRIRRSRVIVEKKNANPLTPLKRAICPSPMPCKDSLYPMRKVDTPAPSTPSAQSIASRCFKSVTGRKSTVYMKRNRVSSKRLNEDQMLPKDSSSSQSQSTDGVTKTTQALLPKSASCFSSMESLRQQNNEFCFGDGNTLDADQVFCADKEANAPPLNKRLRVTGQENRSGTSLIARSIRKARRSRKAKSTSEIDFTSWYYDSNNSTNCYM